MERGGIIEWLMRVRSRNPVGLGEGVHFDVELATPVQGRVRAVLVLMATNMAPCPGNRASLKFAADVVDDVIAGLLWVVPFIREHGLQRGKTIAREFDPAILDIVRVAKMVC